MLDRIGTTAWLRAGGAGLKRSSLSRTQGLHAAVANRGVRVLGGEKHDELLSHLRASSVLQHRRAEDLNELDLCWDGPDVVHTGLMQEFANGQDSDLGVTCGDFSRPTTIELAGHGGGDAEFYMTFVR